MSDEKKQNVCSYCKGTGEITVIDIKTQLTCVIECFHCGGKGIINANDKDTEEISYTKRRTATEMAMESIPIIREKLAGIEITILNLKEDFTKQINELKQENKEMKKETDSIKFVKKIVKLVWTLVGFGIGVAGTSIAGNVF